MNCVLCGSTDTFESYTSFHLQDQSPGFAASEQTSGANSLVKQLREKLVAVKEAVKKLEEIKVDLLTQLNTQLNAIAPIHRLPAEIILSIFVVLVEKCTEDDYLSDRDFTWEETNAVFIHGHLPQYANAGATLL